MCKWCRDNLALKYFLESGGVDAECSICKQVYTVGVNYLVDRREMRHHRLRDELDSAQQRRLTTDSN